MIHRLSYPLSSSDIMKGMNGKTKIISYSQVSNYKSINDLLYPYNNVVILYEWGNRIGHWTSLNKHPNGDLDFFDPYGYKPDDERSFIPDEHWESNFLSQLLANYQGKIYYNEYPLQTKNKNIATCGRWVLMRLILKDEPLDIFTRTFMKINPLDREQLITRITDKLIK